MSIRLSVVIIAKNAAELLPECLSSVDWVDEIILLDSGSSDNTIKIASAAKAKIYINKDWQGYGIQRQRAQSLATGDYILMLDTDERVTLSLQQSIKTVLSIYKPNVVYSIARRNFFLGRFMRYSGWYPDRKIRLYPRKSYQYNDNQVHEALICNSASVVKLNGDLLHLTCQDFTKFQYKQMKYAVIWAQEHYLNNKKVLFISIFGHTLGAFLKTLLLCNGLLDGKRGLLLAVVNAQYTFNKYTELWVLNHGYSKRSNSYD